MFVTDRVEAVGIEHRRQVTLLQHPNTIRRQHGFDCPNELQRRFHVIEHGDGCHRLGTFSAAQAPTGGSREKSFVKPDVRRVLSPKLFGKRIDTDASEAIRGIRFEQRAVVAADVDDDIVCFQVKTVLDPGGHPIQMLAHRSIGVRSVAVVVGIKLSGRH
jgi:hypothetical protein